MAEEKTITGGCLCGRVRYVAKGAPLFGVHCYCRDCQRASGTGHVPVMGVVREGFTVTGEPKAFEKPGGSGETTIRHFCPDCGSLLFGTPQAAPGMVTIYAGSLDDPSRFQPGAAQFTSWRYDWDVCSGDIPAYPGPAP